MQKNQKFTDERQWLVAKFADRVKLSEPLGRYTTFKIGGPADIFLDVRTSDELIEVIQFAVSRKLPYTILGGGTNVLISDNGIRGLVIKNSSKNIRIKGIKGKMTAGVPSGLVYVEADSGVMMNQLVRFTNDEGLAGLEMHLGLPGTVGGAIYMNSKWMHPEGYVGNALYQATILTREGELKDVPQSYFHFAYDMSILQQSGDILIKAVFALKQTEPAQLWEVSNKSIAYRRQTQPQGVASPGCTFRNVTKAEALSIPTPGFTTSAGYLIDHAGLKGVTSGPVEISAVHANFLVNKGGGTARNVIHLIRTVQQEVKNKFGVELHEEIVHLGDFPTD